jgi:catechol 2,3-dioxygenase-like lactoylglutathione lyase family enzyme
MSIIASGPPNFDASDLPVLCPVLHHVNIKTNRQREMIDWYERVIGSQRVFKRHDIAFISNDAANHRIALASLRNYVEPDERESHIGMHHTGFEYRSMDELLLNYVRLKREGIMPVRCLDHGMTTSFYYRDPDGNRVELQCDNWDNWLQSTTFMREDPRFLEDPIGREVDPPKLIEARRAGLSPWEVHVAAYRGDLAPESVQARADGDS